MHPDGGIGVDHAHAVRADHAHAVATGERDQLTLGGRAVLPRLAEPAAEHDQSSDACERALLDDVTNLRRRHRHHGEIDPVGDVEDGRRGTDAGDVLGVRVHGVHRSGESVVQQLAEQLVSQSAGLPPRPDDRDARRLEQAADRSRFGRSGAGLHGRLRLFRRLEPEVHLDDSTLEPAAGLEPGLPEHGDHAPVRGQHHCGERGDPHLAGRSREVLEQDRAQAAALVLVVDEERHLGIGTSWHPVVASDPDELVTEQRDEREPVVTVDVGQVLDFGSTEPRPGAEEPEVDRLRRLAAVEGDESFAIVGADRADVHRPAVRRHHVGVPRFHYADRTGVVPAPTARRARSRDTVRIRDRLHRQRQDPGVREGRRRAVPRHPLRDRGAVPAAAARRAVGRRRTTRPSSARRRRRTRRRSSRC